MAPPSRWLRPWTIIAKSDGQIIGWGGLYHDPFDPGWSVKIGYFFHPAAWGQGNATELAAASLDIADRVLRLPELKAFARPQSSLQTGPGEERV